MQFNLDKQFDSIPCSDTSNPMEITKAISYIENKVSCDKIIEYISFVQIETNLYFVRISTKWTSNKCTQSWRRS